MRIMAEDPFQTVLSNSANLRKQMETVLRKVLQGAGAPKGMSWMRTPLAKV